MIYGTRRFYLVSAHQSLSELKQFSLTVEAWQGYGLPVDFGKKGADGRKKNAAEMVQLPDVQLEMVEAAMRDTLAQVTRNMLVRCSARLKRKPIVLQCKYSYCLANKA